MAGASGKGRHAKGAQHGGTSKKKGMKTSTKVVVIVLAVIMAVSMMIPSLASIFARNDSASTQEEAAQDAGSAAQAPTTSDSGSSAVDTTALTEGVPENLQSVANTYATEVATLQKQLETDPNNLAALINLAHNYTSWGTSAASQATTDEEASYVNGLFGKAIGYYDQYLKLNDSNTAKTERAMCLYFQGDTSGAKAALEEVTTAAPDYGPAWYRLGMLAEIDGDKDAAIADYQKAVEGDANDEYGVKTAASQRLLQLSASSAQSSDATNISSSDSGNATDSGSSKSLSDELSSDSGLGF